MKFPTKITRKAGGFPALDLTLSDIQPNTAVNIQVPDNVRQAAVRVQVPPVTDGIWYFTGGTHIIWKIGPQRHLAQALSTGQRQGRAALGVSASCFTEASGG